MTAYSWFNSYFADNTALWVMLHIFVWYLFCYSYNSSFSIATWFSHAVSQETISLALFSLRYFMLKELPTGNLKTFCLLDSAIQEYSLLKIMVMFLQVYNYMIYESIYEWDNGITTQRDIRSKALTAKSVSLMTSFTWSEPVC